VVSHPIRTWAAEPRAQREWEARFTIFEQKGFARLDLLFRRGRRVLGVCRTAQGCRDAGEAD